MALLEILLLIVTIGYLLYRWGTSKYKTFDERGLPYEKPVPIFGNAMALALNRTSFFKLSQEIYQRNKRHKIFGFYIFREPVFMVFDAECIKKITIKDFDCFPNHMPFAPDKNPLIESMLTMLKDQRWRDMRNTLTPAFTAVKMRSMYSLMTECFAECLEVLHSKCREADGNGFEFEMKEHFTRMSNDVIATTAFGLKVNSYKERDNEFYRVGQSITNIKGKAMVKFVIANIMPWLAQSFNLAVFDVKSCAYFTRLVVDAMKYRLAHNIVRPDMIQLLLEARQESTHQWTDEDLVAQCFTFFFAAFENNANLICTTCYELMRNPDIQQRLYEEAVEIRAQLQGVPLTYDTIASMKYMDMVVSESLRKWTLAVVTDRVCSKEYDLRDDEGKLIFEFKPGDKVLFPIAAYHWDEQNFEHPEIFDPERFSAERKTHIKAGTYMPFGIGPRGCIGNRYALMQAKAMLYHLILNFKMETSAKTVTNLLDDIRGFQLIPQHGFWTRFEPRK